MGLGQRSTTTKDIDPCQILMDVSTIPATATNACAYAGPPSPTTAPHIHSSPHVFAYLNPVRPMLFYAADQATADSWHFTRTMHIGYVYHPHANLLNLGTSDPSRTPRRSDGCPTPLPPLPNSQTGLEPGSLEPGESSTRTGQWGVLCVLRICVRVAIPNPQGTS